MITIRVISVVAAAAAAACTQMQLPTLPSVTPHKMEIQQGNYVTQEMVSKLKPGMTRNQVRFILGTPLVVDPFRTDRWDYYYLLQQRGTTIEQRRMTLVFKDDRLDRIEGDVVPAAGGGVDFKPAAKPAAKPEQAPPAAVPGGGADNLQAPRAERYARNTAGAQLPDHAANDEPGLFDRMLRGIGL